MNNRRTPIAPRPCRPGRRRGMTAVLAMIFVILFATLGIGFYAQVNTAVQVASNEKSIAMANTAADSMMQFVRFHLAKLTIPRNTTQTAMFSTVAAQLQTRLSGSANMSGRDPSITYDVVGNGTIYVPGLTAGGTPTFMTLDDAGLLSARAEIVQVGTNLRVRTIGAYQNAAVDARLARAIRIDYGLAPNASAIFSYGVATKSPIWMNGNVSVIGESGRPENGSVLSATNASVPLTMTGSPEISGDFSFTNATATPSYGSGTIAGYSQTSSAFWDHIHAGVEQPEFPTIDTSAFEAYVPSSTDTGASVITSAAPAGKGPFRNIRIKANTNPSFSSQAVFEGVVFIETPNRVRFGGGSEVRGVVVTQNNPTGTLSSNTIEFLGNVKAYGVETLAESTFGNLTKLKGSMLLADGFAVEFGGNFATVSGSIIASKMRFHGNAGGTVRGSVINLADSAVELSGNSDITIASTGTTNYPSGVFFGNHYAPLADTYAEVPE